MQPGWLLLHFVPQLLTNTQLMRLEKPRGACFRFNDVSGSDGLRSAAAGPAAELPAAAAVPRCSRAR